MKTDLSIPPEVVFRRIVVPHDLTVRSDRALELAATMAHPLRSEVYIVNVIDPTDRRHDTKEEFASRKNDGFQGREHFLKLAAARILPADLKFAVRILEGRPQDAILAEARQLGADLLIVTMHPVEGAGYPFRGGTAEHIMREASCPVLTTQVLDAERASHAEGGPGKFETHNLSQYCEISRKLAEMGAHRTVYLGYSTLPVNPSGICD